jgi:hypothetical protein
MKVTEPPTSIPIPKAAPKVLAWVHTFEPKAKQKKREKINESKNERKKERNDWKERIERKKRIFSDKIESTNLFAQAEVSRHRTLGVRS